MSPDTWITQEAEFGIEFVFNDWAEDQLAVTPNDNASLKFVTTDGKCAVLPAVAVRALVAFCHTWLGDIDVIDALRARAELAEQERDNANRACESLARRLYLRFESEQSLRAEQSAVRHSVPSDTCSACTPDGDEAWCESCQATVSLSHWHCGDCGQLSGMMGHLGRCPKPAEQDAPTGGGEP